MVQAISQFDICCLQEVFGGILTEYRELFLAMALKAGFFYQHCDEAPGMFDTFLGDYGLVILSRLPIVATGYQPYKNSVGISNIFRQGCIYAKIKVTPNQFIHVFNTHFVASVWEATFQGQSASSAPFENLKAL